MASTTPTLRRALFQTLRSPLHARTTRRGFHRSRTLDVVKPFLLADIGEGITECQLIQWFVQPGARVSHFDKICEVQSDKASVEITSPFDGVIKKLHYEPDDMAVTGRPLVDIDIEREVEEDVGQGENSLQDGQVQAEEVAAEGGMASESRSEDSNSGNDGATEKRQRRSESKDDFSTLATPAVRHLTKEMDVDISSVTGSGRDGRVLKEDVHRFVAQRTQQPTHAPPTSSPVPLATSRRDDQTIPLTPVQTQMYKLMTKSLSIPHFLYTTTADLSRLTTLRQALNASRSSNTPKLTHLPFIIKSLSLALQHHPLLNSTLDDSDPKKPKLTYRSSHNIGVAVDTPSGLLVPVLANVQDLSISQIASRLRDLSERARNNKLSPNEFKDATFTVSNIGSVGGGVVSPIISAPQVGILGVGRSKVVPAFDGSGALVKREELVLSWSADHRVVDGAECARCAERVRGLLEEPGSMLVEMK